MAPQPRKTIMTITLAVAIWFAPVEGSKRFLVDETKQVVDRKAFQEDIMNAMGSMLGCGGQVGTEDLASIKKVLAPMWRTLPKMDGRIDRRSLRYLAHRYFMQTSSLMVRGFEPSRPVNESHWGVPDVLSQMVPAYVESVLESKHAKQHGFSLEDSVNLVVMLEQLIFDSESALLEKVYDDQRKPVHRSLSHRGLMQVLEAYMVNWIVEGDAEDIATLIGNKTLLRDVVPHWDSLMAFVEGRMKSLQYAHHKKMRRGRSSDIWANKYSFEDAHEIVGGVTKSFQSFWQSECDSMKNALVKMDLQSTGRVPLAKFYNTTINTDWRFGESESYLRELGALDESSSLAGAQVIIPNYIQATSNCIVSTSHYLVCCVNECETLLGEIEIAIGASSAPPADILQLVGNMTAQSTLDDDESPLVEGALAAQLELVAEAHGGRVRLHSRLFAQWLHYVFPRECPFPHKIGMISSVTPTQYGEDYVATEKDMRRYASNATAIPVAVEKEELQWMSQWSPEEELIVDYSPELHAPWRQRLPFAIVGLVVLGLGVGAGVIRCAGAKGSSRSTHLV